MQIIKITTSQNIDIEYELGGLGERILARIIDYGIFILIGLFAIIGGATVALRDDAAGIVLIIIYATLFVFYDLICEVFMNGQSVGKKIMKIRVISANGAQPRFSQYLLRWLFRIIDFGISGGSVALVVAAINDRVQRVGDIVAGTILIKTEMRTKINQLAFRPAVDGYEPVFAGVSQLSEKDIELINEVINNYVKTGNSMLVYNMANRIKEHLNITPPAEMNDMRFLQIILKDYSQAIVQEENS